MATLTVEFTISDIVKRIHDKGDVAVRSAIEQLKLLLAEDNLDTKKETNVASPPPCDPVVQQSSPTKVNAETRRWYHPIVSGYCKSITCNDNKRQYGQCTSKCQDGSLFCKRHTKTPSKYGIMGEPIPDNKKALTSFKKYSKMYPKPEQKDATKEPTEDISSGPKTSPSEVVTPQEVSQKPDSSPVIEALSSPEDGSVDCSLDDVLDNDDVAKDAETNFVLNNNDCVGEKVMGEYIDRGELKKDEKIDALNKIKGKLNIVVNGDCEPKPNGSGKKVISPNASCARSSFQPNV
jgi:hypothetical protein